MNVIVNISCKKCHRFNKSVVAESLDKAKEKYEKDECCWCKEKELYLYKNAGY